MHTGALMELASHATPWGFRKGEIVFREGDASVFFYVIRKGRVKCLKEAPSGKQFIISVNSNFETLNAAVLFNQNPHSFTAKAMEDTVLFRADGDFYVSWAQRHPSHVLQIVDMMEQALRTCYDRLIDAVGERVEQRMCHVLNLLCGKFGASLNFTCEEIAELSGTTTETAIRILAKLKTTQVLGSIRGKIHVLDPAELKRLSRGRLYAPGRI